MLQIYYNFRHYLNFCSGKVLGQYYCLMYFIVSSWIVLSSTWDRGCRVPYRARCPGSDGFEAQQVVDAAQLRR